MDQKHEVSTTPEPDPRVLSMLDSLGALERAEPDVGFEARVADAASRAQARVPGRRRLTLAPALLTGAAALIAVVFLLLPAPPVTPVREAPSDLAALEDASFGLFDDTFGLTGDMASADADLDSLDPTSFDEWLDTGDAL